MSSQRIHSQVKALKLAFSSWVPTSNEKQALGLRKYVKELGRVDQIWLWLNSNHGSIMAVDAPHALHPERWRQSDSRNGVSWGENAYSK